MSVLYHAQLIFSYEFTPTKLHTLYSCWFTTIIFLFFFSAVISINGKNATPMPFIVKAYTFIQLCLQKSITKYIVFAKYVAYFIHFHAVPTFSITCGVIFS